MLRPDIMIDSENDIKPMQPDLACNSLLDGDTIQLQNGGCQSDVAQSYTSSDGTEKRNVLEHSNHAANGMCEN